METVKFLTIDEVALRLKVTTRTVWNREKTGKMPRAWRNGTLCRWNLEDIKAYERKLKAEAK